MVGQISVFLENTQGSLARVARLLADAGVNLSAVSMADTTYFGILRAVVDDVEKAAAALRQGGFTSNRHSVPAFSLPSGRPGALAEIMEHFSAEGINVEYVYSTNCTADGQTAILCKTDDDIRAEALARANGLTILTQQDLSRKQGDSIE